MSRLNKQSLHSLELREPLAQPRSPTPKELGWTDRQRFIQAELDTFLDLAAPPSDLRLSIVRGLLRQDVEGQDRRFLAWRTWFSIEHSVIDEHRVNGSIPWGLSELARFDDLILPHFVKVLAPQEKEAFVEFAIKHLAWVGYNGFSSEQHIEATQHAVQLLRRSLIDVLEHSSRFADILRRLGHVVAPLFDPRSLEEAHELLPAVYSVLEQLLKTPIPWQSVQCFEVMTSLHSHINWHLSKATNLGDQVLLSDYINQDSDAAEGECSIQSNESGDDRAQFDWEQFDEDEDLSDLTEDESLPVESLEHLNVALLKALVQATSTQDCEFWRDFLTQNSLSAPEWLLGIQGLERSNPYEYDAFVHKLILAASQSPFGARHIIALAILDEDRSWKPSCRFISTVSEISERLREKTRESVLSQLENVVFHYATLVSEALSDQVPPRTLNRVAISLQRAFNGEKGDRRVT
jgi:hypothetical protein